MAQTVDCMYSLVQQQVALHPFYLVLCFLMPASWRQILHRKGGVREEKAARAPVPGPNQAGFRLHWGWCRWAPKSETNGEKLKIDDPIQIPKSNHATLNKTCMEKKVYPTCTRTHRKISTTIILIVLRLYMGTLVYVLGLTDALSLLSYDN